MRTTTVIAIGLCALLSAGTGYAQTTALYDLQGTFDGQFDSPGGFGGQVLGLDDVDGDGFGEFVIASPFAEVDGADAAGRVRVFDGATGAILDVIDGEPIAGDSFGRIMARAGDVDGDGAEDFLVAATVHDGPAGLDAGKVYLYSGRTRALLRTYEGEAAGDRFGGAVAGIGDVNGDLVPDVLIGSSLHSGPNGLLAGKVYAYSGADGSLLWSVDGSGLNTGFASGVGLVGDVDGDGVNDVCVGEPGFAPPPPEEAGGRGFILSGADGSEIDIVTGNVEAESFGRKCDGPGDVDGDGVPDVLFSALTFDNFRGRVTMFSGATGEPLYGLVGDEEGDNFGLWMCAVGDVTGSTVPDILVAAPLASFNGFFGAGSAKLFEGRLGTELLEFGVEIPGALLGNHACGGGDIDGNGRPDLLIGAISGGEADLGTVTAYSVELDCLDLDEDGYGSPASELCPEPLLDCNDYEPTANPLGIEEPGNGIDENCNGSDLCGSIPVAGSSGGAIAVYAGIFGALARLRRRRRG